MFPLSYKFVCMLSCVAACVYTLLAGGAALPAPIIASAFAALKRAKMRYKQFKTV